MLHYHGLPINPAVAAATVLDGRHAFVSFIDTLQLEVAVQVCQSIAADCGAFSAWKDKRPITDWTPYYRWLDDEFLALPIADFAIVPDVIDGTEEANDELLAEWPFDRHQGAPVWHLHESLERLRRLVTEWPRVALGSSGAYAEIGTPGWKRRMAEAMSVACDENGAPLARLHGLRMLDSKVLEAYPFASADSTNIARNIGIDKAWRGTYLPPTKPWRALVLAARIERTQSPMIWTPPLQEEMDFALRAPPPESDRDGD